MAILIRAPPLRPRNVPISTLFLNSYLPADGAPTISSTILHDPARRSVWRALAIGARTRSQVSEITGYPRVPRQPDSRDVSDLSALDAGLRTRGAR